jgi:purine-binding chemotaxis protein CheW
MASRQICTFMVDKLHLGIDVIHVQEVLRSQEMTEVPLAPPAVRGLINLRGQIVTALDMRQRLKLNSMPPEEPPMNVIVQSSGTTVSLLVDSIGDVEDVVDEWLEPAPETLDPETKAIVTAVCKLNKSLLLVVDPRAIVDGLMRSEASKDAS